MPLCSPLQPGRENNCIAVGRSPEQARGGEGLGLQAQAPWLPEDIVPLATATKFIPQTAVFWNQPRCGRV